MKFPNYEDSIEHCHRKENQSYHSPSPNWVSLVHKVDTVVDVRSNVKQEKTQVWAKEDKNKREKDKIELTKDQSSDASEGVTNRRDGGRHRHQHHQQDER